MKCLHHMLGVHWCHLREVAIFYMCREGPASRSFSHHLNQSEVSMRPCHIRAYVGNLISLVNCHCTTFHPTKPKTKQRKVICVNHKCVRFSVVPVWQLNYGTSVTVLMLLWAGNGFFERKIDMMSCNLLIAFRFLNDHFFKLLICRLILWIHFIYTFFLCFGNAF